MRLIHILASHRKRESYFKGPIDPTDHSQTVLFGLHRFLHCNIRPSTECRHIR